MGNYKYTYYPNSDIESCVITFSDNYTTLNTVSTVFDAITNIHIGGLTQKLEGETLNVFSDRFGVDIIGGLETASTSNTEFVTEIISIVNNGTEFYCNITIDSSVLFAGKLDRKSFGFKVNMDNRAVYTHEFLYNDYSIEFEATGSNIFKEIQNDAILTETFMNTLITDGVIENKQGAYKLTTDDGDVIDTITQKLMPLGTFLEYLLEELKTYINTEYTLALTSRTLNAEYTTIGVATGSATVFANNFKLNLSDSTGDYRFSPFSHTTSIDGNAITGNTKNQNYMWNNTQTLYLNNSSEKNNIYVSANLFFDDVPEVDRITGKYPTPNGYLNNEADIYRIRTSTDNIFDMLYLMFFNLSLNFEILIDGTELILNVYTLDEAVELQDTIYTKLIDEFEVKIKEEENEDDIATVKYTALANAYSYCDEHYNTGANTVEIEDVKPLPFTIAPSYKDKTDRVGFIGVKEPLSTMFANAYGTIKYAAGGKYLTIQDGLIGKFTPYGGSTYYFGNDANPITTMFMKIEGYSTTPYDTNDGFDIYRPTDFWCPIGKLAYKITTPTGSKTTVYKDITSKVRDLINRYKGNNDVTPLQEASATIPNLSDFAINAIGSSPSIHNLRCGKNIEINDTTYFITGVERDFDNLTTKLTLIANDFFNVSTPDIDTNDDDNESIIIVSDNTEIEIGEDGGTTSAEIFDLVAYNNIGQMSIFENSIDYYNEIVGIVTSITIDGSDNYLTVVARGKVENPAWAWTADSTVYGYYNVTNSKVELTQTEPTKSANDEMLIIVGRAVTTTMINIDISNYIFE